MLPHKLIRQLGFGVCLFMLLGCNPFQPEPRSPATDQLPKAYSLYSGQAEATQNWWEEFADPELTQLIQTALSDSFTLQVAWSRLNQARALAVQAGAERYPDLTASGDARVGRLQTRNGSSTRSDIESFGLGLYSSYELDLWGRVRAQYETALLQTEASREDINTATTTLASEVANRWIQIIAQRMQKDLLENQLRTNKTLLELVQLRFRNALVSALDVYQQKQVVENIQADLPLVEETEQLLLNELAVLLGKPARTPLAITRSQLPEPTPLPPTGIPADLLAMRPDVRAAGLRLQAADWQIAAARANRLPSLSLTAQARYGESEFNVLFDNWLLSLAANLTAPLIDGGFRAAEVDRTRAVAEENLASYRNAVLTAVREVEDALVSETKQRKHIEALRQVNATARRALEEAGVRYRNGLNDYLPVLTQLLAVQGLERDLIRAQADLLVTRVQLHRALGGTWPENFLPPQARPQTHEKKTASLPRS
jgi:NodT family efflux transporter outer membrane factor (OMF) lipoprotein